MKERTPKQVKLIQDEIQRWMAYTQGCLRSFQERHILRYPATEWRMGQFPEGFWAIIPITSKGLTRTMVMEMGYPWIQFHYPEVAEYDR